MNASTNMRALTACSALAVCFTGFSARLLQLQVTDHDFYVEKATSQNTRKLPIYARRGDIMDIKGLPLAQDEPVKTVVADASLISDPAALAKLLAEPLKLTTSELREKFARTTTTSPGKSPRPCRYIILKKDVPESNAVQIGTLVARARAEKVVAGINAIRFEQNFIRVYPNGSTLCHVLGYVDDSGKGIDGIESSLEERLQGRNGERSVAQDPSGQEIVPYRGTERAAIDGRNVRLTIDMGLQRIVESELEEAVRKFRPKKATVIMMNPHNGDIMAMANRPNFDPNPIRDMDEDRSKARLAKLAKMPFKNRRNIAITDQVEPGSTFKVVTTAAALSEGNVGLDTEIFCENGYWSAYKLHDSHPYSSLSVRNILVKSSNIGAAKLGIQLGEQKFYEFVLRFGFGSDSGISLPGEIRGQVNSPFDWEKLTLSRMTMGHSISATALQIVNSICVVANGGTLMAPQIVREVMGDDSSTEFKPQEIRRVVSKRTCDQVREALVQVVSPKGTAPAAQVSGFKVAGKTGTAQKPDENGRMGHENFVVSFVGFMPAENPAFAIIVLLDEAQTSREENYGGAVAGPIFSKIATKAASYLDLIPTEKLPPSASKKGGNSERLNVRGQ